MKKIIAAIILLIAASVLAEPTDYIDGKWYTCDTWTVNAAGDTLFTSNMYGTKTWYSYNKKHQRTGFRMSDGTKCRDSYTASGNRKGEHCSDGDWYTYKYNRKGQLIQVEDWRTRMTLDYDRSGNVIHKKIFLDVNWDEEAGTAEIWNEYNSDNALVKTIHSDSHGYISKKWFDEHGYAVRDSSRFGDRHFENKYDQNGMIVYEGMSRRAYKYFQQEDTMYRCIDEN